MTYLVESHDAITLSLGPAGIGTGGGETVITQEDVYKGTAPINNSGYTTRQAAVTFNQAGQLIHKAGKVSGLQIIKEGVGLFRVKVSTGSLGVSTDKWSAVMGKVDGAYSHAMRISKDGSDILVRTFNLGDAEETLANPVSSISLHLDYQQP